MTIEMEEKEEQRRRWFPADSECDWYCEEEVGLILIGKGMVRW